MLFVINIVSFLKKFLKITSISLLLILVVLVSLAPFVVRWQAVKWLEEQGLQAEIGYISIRPVLGSVQINDVRITASETEQLVIDRLNLNIDWTPLLDHSLYIEHVNIDGLLLDIVAAKNGWRVGGIALPNETDGNAAVPENSQSAEDPTLASVMLKYLALKDAQICYTQLEQDVTKARQCMAFDHFAMADGLVIHFGDRPSMILPRVTLKKFRWFDKREPTELLWLDLVDVNAITSEDLIQWQVADIAIESLGILPIGSDDKILAGDLRFATLSISGLEVGDDSSIDKIRLSGLAANMNLNGHGEAIFSPQLMARIEQLVPASSGGVVEEQEQNSSAFSVGQLVMDSVSISDGSSHQRLLLFNNFKLENLSLSGSNIGLGNIQLSDLTLLPTMTEKGGVTGGDLQLSKFSLTDLRVDDSSRIGAVLLSGVKLDLHDNDEGKLDFVPQLRIKIEQLLPEPSVEQETVPEGSSHFSLDQLTIDSIAVQDKEHNQRLLSLNGLSLKKLSLIDGSAGLGQLEVVNVTLLPVVSEQHQATAGVLQLSNLLLSNATFGDDSHIDTLSLSGIQVGLESAANGQLAFAPKLLERIIPSAKDSALQEDRRETNFLLNQLRVNDVFIRDSTHQRNLLLLNQIDLSDLILKGEDVTLGRLQLDNLKLLEPIKKQVAGAEYYFVTPKIELVNINKTISQLSLKSLIVVDPEIFIHRNRFGKLQLLEDIEQMMGDQLDADDNSSVPTSESTEVAATVRYSADLISIGSKGSISVLDEGVSPIFQQSFNDLNFSLNNIDSSAPQTKSAVSFYLGLTQFGHIKFDGVVSPFGQKLNTDIVGELRGLDTRMLSRYVENSIGYSLDQGVAEFDIDFTVNEDNLKAKVDTRFSKLKVSVLDEAELPEGVKALGMPLDFALGLLRDKNGMIELRLPVSGNIHTPNFSISHTVAKVMIKVMSQTIVNYYLPFGLIIASTLQDTLSSFSFDPVIFAPGDSMLDTTAMAGLDKISIMLNSREQLSLSFCTHSTWQDWVAKFGSSDDLSALAENTSADAVSAESEILEGTESIQSTVLPVVTPEQVALLKTVANQRSEVVKEYLLSKGVKNGQVILCGDKFNPADKNLPQISISI